MINAKEILLVFGTSIVYVYGCSACWSDQSSNLVLASNPDQPALRFAWEPGELMLAAANTPKPVEPLNVQVLRQPISREGTMQIMKEGKVIFSFSPHQVPDSLFSLDGYDCNLATLWKTGGDGRWYLYVFSYKDGAVKQTLKANSLLRPEFIYPPKGLLKGDSCKDKNGRWQLRNGPMLHQKIIIADTKWVRPQNRRSENLDLVPVRADIFSWDEGTARYIQREGVTWARRFEHL